MLKDNLYRTFSDKNITGLSTYNDQFIYIDDKAVFSNAWAGKLFASHSLAQPEIVEGGNDFAFLISAGHRLQLVSDSGLLWESIIEDDTIQDIRFDKANKGWWILCNSSLRWYKPGENKPGIILEDMPLTCFTLSDDNLWIGTTNGYLRLDTRSHEQTGSLEYRLPCPELTCIAEADGNLWFGSHRGAMMLRDDGKYNYYASERWLPSDTVISIIRGPEKSVLILTSKGLAVISFDNITLYDKAMYYESQVRERHIRNGFNATLAGMKDGNIAQGSLEDSDNDGLWTSMYLAAEAFRYSVTKSEQALQNIRESLDAMERLYTITQIPGFPARSFERRGYKYDDVPWRRASDPEWDWKSTTSSDEAIGHMFAFGVLAELIVDPAIRNKAIMLMDTLMSHILKNNLYLVDWDGQPTRWGRWNPVYVNAFPEMVGDRKLNSSNIIGMLQTSYRFTGKEKYKDAAFSLMKEHGYLNNLMRPMKGIWKVPPGTGELSEMLSDGWNHSDDEMYFLGYWGLYRYAFNDTLKRKYREAIIDHWNAERVEKDGLWNIITAITDAEDFDLEEAIWYLKEYPVDMIDWSISNSHRKDLDLNEPDFRNQITGEVLPPDELRISRHNANRFIPDGGNNGNAEMSAGDIWLLPYWMGRYLRVIGAPSEPF